MGGPHTNGSELDAQWGLRVEVMQITGIWNDSKSSHGIGRFARENPLNASHLILI